MFRLLAGILMLLTTVVGGQVAAASGDVDDKEWVESEVVLPEFPQDADLIEFYVSAVTANRFFVDGKTLSVGSDGVVRYVLVVKTAGGATNVSYEGMRCSERELKLYATGRADRTWAASRVIEWRPIVNKPVNRHHAALSRSYFCPNNIPIFKAVEGRDALQRGGHPDVDKPSSPGQ